MKRYHIGCSGWSYGDWAGRFYPDHLSPRDLLRFYSNHFGTVEIDYTYYHYPSKMAVGSWGERTPEGFLFAVKLNRVITHFKRLAGVDSALASFLEIISGLGEKLGPLLVQLPPDLAPDHRRLEGFLALLPRSMSFAFEFRDPEWLTRRTYGLLERYGVALCLADSGSSRITDQVTAPFAYIRWHGRQELGYDYSRDVLMEFVPVLETLGADEIFGYFNNDMAAHAPSNAKDLISLIEDRDLVLAT